MTMETLVLDLECKNKMPGFVLQAYLLSFVFLAVFLFLAVGDAFHQPAELLLYSISDYSFTSHYYFDSGFFPWIGISLERSSSSSSKPRAVASNAGSGSDELSCRMYSSRFWVLTQRWILRSSAIEGTCKLKVTGSNHFDDTGLSVWTWANLNRDRMFEIGCGAVFFSKACEHLLRTTSRKRLVPNWTNWTQNVSRRSNRALRGNLPGLAIEVVGNEGLEVRAMNREQPWLSAVICSSTFE